MIGSEWHDKSMSKHKIKRENAGNGQQVRLHLWEDKQPDNILISGCISFVRSMKTLGVNLPITLVLDSKVIPFTVVLDK